jgi:hypothetical protein
MGYYVNVGVIAIFIVLLFALMIWLGLQLPN